MARITVEGGLKVIPNRFKLAIAAAKRAKQILAGSALAIIVDGENKAVVNALREIEANKVRLATAEEVKESQEKKKTEALDALFSSADESPEAILSKPTSSGKVKFDDDDED